MKNTMEIIIDRLTWRRGGRSCWGRNKNKKGTGDTKLKNKNSGHMCCLGQWIAQTDPEIDIVGRDSPSATRRKIKHLTKQAPSGMYRSTDLANAMMRCNDNRHIDDVERESTLTELAADVGVTLKFTN